jgi:hypothetical protein
MPDILPNLPGILSTKVDGNLQVTAPDAAPIVLVLGTATKGDTSKVYRVDRFSDAVSAFGLSGTLIRGMTEAANAGAVNLRLFRIGAKPARLRKFISSKVNITTVQMDRFAGDDYEVTYTASSGLLVITHARSQGVAITPVIVYQATAGGTPVTNTGEVIVDGTWNAADGVDIPATTHLKAVPAVAADATSKYHDGTDGTDISRMELWESLQRAYSLLLDQPFDYVVPMDVYLDDKNITDLDNSAIPTFPTQTDTTVYPVLGATNDVLGKVYTEEFEGDSIFWWNSSKSDATAEIAPQGFGSASSTLKSDGSSLVAADFHEVNFAYQLSNFCFLASQQQNECHGMIGVKPPVSTSLKDLATWFGKSPIVNASGVITTNGTGLLGNKFMGGRLTSGNIAGLTINGVDGKADGGFINTDSGFIDGVQQKDRNNKLVDMGKYLSVCAAQALFSNLVNSSYTSTIAAAYAGFVSTLPIESAPTNKVLPSVGLNFNLNISKTNELAGKRYIALTSKLKGVVIADAPTAARPDSDYRRLSTNRIVKAAVDAVRAVSEPYLGEGLSGARMAALDTAQEQILTKLQKAGILKRYDKRLSATPDQAVLGQGTVELTLVPAFELRKLTVIVALAKQ